MSEKPTALETETRRFLANLVGDWSGTSKTWFDPSAAPEHGATQTAFRDLVDELFVQEEYRSFVGEKPHTGSRILGFNRQTSEVSLYWVDSFHTGSIAMNCSGGFKEDRMIVLGHYKGGAETWGWRTEIVTKGEKEIHILQYNIWPSGQVDLAIETVLMKKAI